MTPYPNMDRDSTPVFYSSKQLQLTGMKITAGSKVYPVSSVAGVEVRKTQGIEYLGDVLKALLFGVFIVLIGQWLTPMTRFGYGLTALGFLLLLIAGLGTYRIMYERVLHIRMSTLDSLKVAVYDDKTVWAMHSAVEQAMTWNMNKSGYVPSVADELGKLAGLRDLGILTHEDWARAKDLFLGKQPSAQETALQQLQQLYDLRKSGVLSESEFNLKKWDVLSRR